MNGITFDKHADEVLGEPHLTRLLKVMGGKASHTRWRIGEIDGSGPTVSTLENVPGGGWSTSQLLELLDGVDQLVDADFEGFMRDDTLPWIRVTFVDGRSVDVESVDESVLSAIKSEFENARPLP